MGTRASYLIFSINSFAAAMLALWIGFSIGLPRPYWAMLTVYITAQPLTGALRSKALYRVIGTVAGGTMAVILVPTFVNSPMLMSVAMAAWTGLCLYISLLDRTPRAYVFMLAGYTTAIIGFPSVAAPDAIFDTALARVEEIVLGIGCATAVHSIVFPRDVGQVLVGRVKVFLRDGQTWIGDALASRRTAAERDERRRLAADVTELHVTSSHLPFDTSDLPLRIGTVRALENRLAYMLPLISALDDRLTELGERDKAFSQLLSDVTAWAEIEGPFETAGEDAAALKGRCRTLMPKIEGEAEWRSLLKISILVRLEELIEALQDSRDLGSFISGEVSASLRVSILLRTSQRRPLHLDRGMAALSGLALMVAVLICCAIWILTAWPEGAIAATMAAVFSSFFAAQDDPAPAIVGFLVWSLLALPLAALYLFAILPAIDGFPMLVFVLAPALLVIGYLQAVPAWAPRAIALLIGFAGALSLQATFSANMAEFLNANMAQIVGVAMALVATRLMRSVGAGWAARRILRRGWREVAALARLRSVTAADVWIAGMLDRVGLVATRVALAAPEDSIYAYDALADMRVGLNVIDLERIAAEAGGPRSSAFDEVLAAVAHVFERRAVDGRSGIDPSLLRAIDRAITVFATQPSVTLQPRGFAALTGLRRNLFPTAPPYSPVQLEAA
jgi:uncharacterized membrane protein YccC